MSLPWSPGGEPTWGTDASGVRGILVAVTPMTDYTTLEAAQAGAEKDGIQQT